MSTLLLKCRLNRILSANRVLKPRLVTFPILLHSSNNNTETKRKLIRLTNQSHQLINLTKSKTIKMLETLMKTRSLVVLVQILEVKNGQRRQKRNWQLRDMLKQFEWILQPTPYQRNPKRKNQKRKQRERRLLNLQEMCPSQSRWKFKVKWIHLIK